eukprot:SAG11_NODE_3888_length_2165_cov_1.057599_2_plen_152_part_00
MDAGKQEEYYEDPSHLENGLYGGACTGIVASFSFGERLALDLPNPLVRACEKVHEYQGTLSVLPAVLPAVCNKIWWVRQQLTSPHHIARSMGSIARCTERTTGAEWVARAHAVRSIEKAGDGGRRVVRAARSEVVQIVKQHSQQPLPLNVA